jgi:hypothetical protein
VPALHAALSDRTPAVRRRAAASLGELLFYFSNADPPSHPEATWPQAAAIVADVARLLRTPDEDAAARHYAAKAVDNLMTGSDFWAGQFACEDTAVALLEARSAFRSILTRLDVDALRMVAM